MDYISCEIVIHLTLSIDEDVGSTYSISSKTLNLNIMVLGERNLEILEHLIHGDS